MRILAAILFFAVAARAAGVLETNGPVRLVAHRVEATVHDRVAEVAVEHVFHNDGTRALEGRYLFPLPDGATVSEFAMTMGDRLVKGVVLERGKAERIYSSIVNRKKDPGLLEKVDRGLFRARVFPIEPRQDLTIRLVYHQLLPEDAGVLELRYPLGSPGSGDAATVSVHVAVESTVDLSSVTCPAEGARVERDGPRRASVAWEGGYGRDFQLLLVRPPEAVTFSLLSHREADGPGTFLAVLAPVEEAKPVDILPKDVLYVLDVSGSMRGPKMEQATAALRFGIGSLRPGDRFNVIAFSTEARAFRDAPVVADAASKEGALAWVDGLLAAGGTALDDALQRALGMAAPGRLTIVTLLTDGLPTIGTRDPQEIVARVEKANRAHARVFVFGVGFDQNVAFLDRIARMTRGAREYITPEEDLEIPLSRFFRRIDQPVLRDLALDLGPGVAEVYPRDLPDLFAGDRLVVVGTYDTPGPRAVRLTGRLQGREVTYVYEGTLAERKAIPALPRLWAERKVAFLLEQIDLNGRSGELVDEVVRLGTKYSIVTPYTSGLVVEDEELEAQADAPFEGPSTNAAIGLAGGGKRGRGGIRNLRAGGGTNATENAVDLGLRWLAQAQDPQTWDWGGPEPTAQTLLAFLGAGYTDRGTAKENKYAATVRQGLYALIRQQNDDGSFEGGLGATAQATLALAEAYWMTRNPRYKGPAQKGLDHLARVRQRDDGWMDDIVLTAWCVFALRSGKYAGLEIDPDAFDGARALFDRRTPATAAERSAMLLARIFTGEAPRTSAVIKHLATGLEPGRDDLDHLVLGTMGAFQVGGAFWRRWNDWMVPEVVRTQEGKDAGARWGSWAGVDPADEGARIRRTAAMVCCLEVYYRYDRVFGIGK